MAKKPIIAIDVDDVLASSAAGFVAYSNKRWGTNLTVEEYGEHWGEMWGINHDEAIKRAQDIYNSGIQRNFIPFDEAAPVLGRLAKDFELVITTSRHKLVEQTTLEWLDEHHKGVFSRVHFAGIWDSGHHTDQAFKMTKAEVLLKIGADYLIDDQPKHCIAAAEAGIPALLFGDYSWNRGVTVPDGVTPVLNWVGVERFLDAERSQKLS